MLGRVGSSTAAILLVAFSLFGQTFQAKVVGISDGDTITVYDGTRQTRIRLEGIDCPESGADFSNKAIKQSSSPPISSSASGCASRARSGISTGVSLQNGSPGPVRPVVVLEA